MDECPKCKGSMVEQEFDNSMATSAMGVGGRNLKPFICKDCGYVELWT